MPADQIGTGAGGAVGFVRLVFPASPLAVRAALERLLATLPPELLAEELRSTAEIVISEVLNNIVEHAYSGARGEIDLSIWPVEGGLQCAVSDHGAPMPEARLPTGDLPALPGDEIPEGGFGWHLIRSLAQDIRYMREGEANLLTFRLPELLPVLWTGG